jgi:hypothetical protein
MKKVLIVTGPEVECGIYQYGLATYNILKNSNKNHYEFLATDSPEEFMRRVRDFDVVVYNHHPHTLNWLSSGITRPLHNEGVVKQIVIYGHEHKNKFTGVDAYLVTDPYAEIGENEYNDMPPITNYENIVYSPPKSIIKIGTSGIGNRTKNLSQIVKLINNQFTEEVILNLHVSDGKFVDFSGQLSMSLIEMCKRQANENVQIKVTRGFLDKLELVFWLNENDINLYWYDTPNVPGVSGSINRAIEAKKPFGVNQSSFFSHVRRDYNDLTKTSIKEIVGNGYQPFEEFLNMWSSHKFIENYESIIEKI